MTNTLPFGNVGGRRRRAQKKDRHGGGRAGRAEGAGAYSLSEVLRSAASPAISASEKGTLSHWPAL